MNLRSGTLRCCVLAWLLCQAVLAAPPPAAAGVEPPPANRLRVNVNTASLKELLLFPRIDLELAARIMLERSAAGPFDSLEALESIEGMGGDLLKSLAEDFIFTGESSVPADAYRTAQTRRVTRREKVRKQQRQQAPAAAATTAAAAEKKQEERIPIDLVADYLEYKSREQIMVAKGAAQVVHGDMHIRARVIEADMVDEKLMAYGDVVYEQGEGKEAQNLQGDMIVYDLKTGAARVRNGWTRKMTKEGMLIYGAEQMEAGERIITGKNAFYTTCERKAHEHWKIVAASVTVYPKKRMVLRNATTYIGGQKIYSVRRKVIPLGERAEPDLKPGYRQDRGLYVEYNSHYDVDEDNYGKVSGKWFQEKGQGLGVTHHYRYGEKTDGTIMFDVWDESTIGSRAAAVRSLLSRQRWTADWNLGYRMDEAASGTMKTSFSRNQRLGEAANDEMRLNFTMAQRKQGYSLNLKYNERVDLDGDKYTRDQVRTVDRLPEITLTTTSKPIGNTDLRHSMQFGIGRYREIAYPGGQEERTSTFRDELKYTVSHRALQFMDKKVNLTPKVVYQKIRYQTAGDLESIQINLNSTQKYKKHWKGSAYYDWKKANGASPLSLVSSDSQAQSERNLLRYNLNYQPDSTFRLKLIDASYQFPTSTTRREGFNSVYSHLSLGSPTGGYRKWSFTMQANYNFHRKKFSELTMGDIDLTSVRLSFNTSLKDYWTDNERWNLRLASSYDHTDHRFQYFDGTLSFPAGEKIRMDLRSRYDVPQKKFTSGHLSVVYDLHCWEAKLDIGQKKRDLQFMIYLKAFPEKPFGVKYDDDRQVFMPYYGDRDADNLYY